MKRLAHWITGVGCLSAAGADVSETTEIFFSEKSRTASALDRSEDRFLKILLQSDWLHRFDFREDGFMPNLYALKATQEALDSAGFACADLRKLRVGVCLGSTVGATNYQEGFALDYNHGRLPSAKALFDFFQNNSAQFISRYFGCRGPVQMINNACTSGADAIGIAAQWLDADLCDLVICGGTEKILPKIFYGFKSLMLCSPELCQPFDQSRKGLTLGEGAGILILEKADSKRTPKARFLGYGSGTDAFHPTSPHPEARGLQLAAQMAVLQAGVKTSEVDFINAHGTATPHNDLAEGKWIRMNSPEARVVATKGYTGHTLGAAGGIEAVFTVLSLLEQKLPISKGFQKSDPEIGISPTTQIEKGDFKVALSFSLGFGGTNAALCLGSAV